jgi:hypothetical protein
LFSAAAVFVSPHPAVVGNLTTLSYTRLPKRLGLLGFDALRFYASSGLFPSKRPILEKR